MSELTYIVSRHESQLYAELRRSFADEPDIEVLVDRRRAERRQTEAVAAIDRRAGDRRQRDISQALNGLGWALVPTVRHDRS